MEIFDFFDGKFFRHLHKWSDFLIISCAVICSFVDLHALALLSRFVTLFFPKVLLQTNSK